MLTPTHMCLIITLNYFKADFFKTLTPVIVAEAVLLAMEQRLGVTFTYEGTSYDAIIQGLQSKRFDAGFSSVGTTAERLKTLDFVSQRRIGTSCAYPKDSTLDI